MPEVELSAGTIEYQDTGGDGPPVVLLHGLLMDHTLWREVLPGLGAFRCILPTLPLGAHRRPMRPDAELGLWAQVELVAEFLDALELEDVTLVSSDWGGATLLTAAGRDARVGRLVICSGELFDNYPPGIARAPGRHRGAHAGRDRARAASAAHRLAAPHAAAVRLDGQAPAAG